jgi:hypothetical protein
MPSIEIRERPIGEEAPREDLVSFAASYPRSVEPRGHFLLKIWVFQQKNRQDAKIRAIEESREEINFQSQGGQLLRRMTRVNINVIVDRCKIVPESTSLVWGGETTNVAFQAAVSSKVDDGMTLQGVALLMLVDFESERLGLMSLLGEDPVLPFRPVRWLEQASSPTQLGIGGLYSEGYTE